MLANINESASAQADGHAAGRAPRKQQSIEIIAKTKREPSRCSAARTGEETKYQVRDQAKIKQEQHPLELSWEPPPSPATSFARGGGQTGR
jgi:hypothetical protein